MSDHGTPIGWYTDPDQAVCAACAPPSWNRGDYAGWPGSRGWETPAPIITDDAGDTPTHCHACRNVIAHILTPDGLDYISDALGRALSDGNAGPALASWMAEYGDHVNVVATYLDEFIAGYAHAMLWANLSDIRDTEGAGCDATPGDWRTPANGWQLAAFDPASQEDITAECAGFIKANWADLTLLHQHDYGWRDNGTPDATRVADSAGHDFALTRNHHGAGYWCRDLGDLGDRLTTAAHAYGESTCEYDSENPGQPVQLM
jgi:hypothetical protein